MENGKFVYFKLSGAPHGMAHHAGDVAEVSSEDFERLTEAGVCRAAKADEEAVAKSAIAKEAAAAKAAKAAEGPTNAELLAEIAALKAALAKK